MDTTDAPHVDSDLVQVFPTSLGEMRLYPDRLEFPAFSVMLKDFRSINVVEDALKLEYIESNHQNFMSFRVVGQNATSAENCKMLIIRCFRGLKTRAKGDSHGIVGY